MTHLDQLAHIIHAHVPGKPNGGTATGSWVTCSCGHKCHTMGDRDFAEDLGRKHLAQAILDAGWTPPPTAPTALHFACMDCNQPITGPLTTIGKRFFHPDCLPNSPFLDN